MPCLTLTLLPHILQTTPVPLPSPPPGTGLAERDPYDLPNAATSAHFAVRWGSGGGVDEADVERILESFERSWEVEIDTLGMAAPRGSDDWLFNVYIGDTGDGAPSAGGVYGYYSVDGQGWPMIVLSPDMVAASQSSLTTIPHEFFHALQDAAGSYTYSGESAWWWEATATWIESVVYPDDPAYAVFLFGFAFLPHYPLTFFDYYDTGAFQEYYQYGAFIFPRYIAEQVADPETIVETWMDPRGHDEPLAPLGELLAEQGVDLEDAIVAFSAHNAVWDYEDGSTYAYYLDYYAGFPEYASSDHRVTDTIDPGGTDGWASPPAETLPGRYGYNVLSMPEPGAGSLWLSLDGEDTGSAGSPARWSAVVVTEDGPTYHTLAEGEGSIEVVGIDGALSVVVVALAEAAGEGETFSYRYAVGDAPLESDAGADTGEDTGGEGGETCGCRGPGSATGALLVPLYGSFRSRRRKTTIPSPSANRSS